MKSDGSYELLRTAEGGGPGNSGDARGFKGYFPRALIHLS